MRRKKVFKKALVLQVSFLLLFIYCFVGCRTEHAEIHTQKEDGSQEQASQEMNDSFAKPTIQFCIDLFYPVSDTEVRPFFNQIAGQNQDFFWTYETIPREDPERTTYLTRLRTEIMAGKGPDIFLCNCSSSYEEGLFKYPKQAMNNHIFLPLDNYISIAEYMEWEKLFPSVMKAGQNADSQQILPLTYEFSILMFDKESQFPKVERPMSWEQMVAANDPSVESAAYNGELSDIFGELGDYDRDIPTFTEEEFLARAKEDVDLEYNGYGKFVEWTDGWLVSTDESGGNSPLALGENGEEYFMLPAYNITGGITANITTFAAINRNTAYPSEAFHALDYLLSKSAQQNEDIYKCMKGWPVHADVGSKDAPRHLRHMSEGNWDEFSVMRDQVNAVKYYTPLDYTIHDISRQWYHSKKTDEALGKIVHSVYTTIKMMLAES